MIPTRSLVILAAIPVVLGALAAGIDGAIWPMLAVDVVIVIVASLDLLFSFGKVSVERQFAEVQAVGRPFPVRLIITNRGRRRLQLRVTDDAPGNKQGLPAILALASGLQTDVDYELQVDQRGKCHFGPVTIRWTSLLGFWERQRQHPVDGEVRIYPDFKQLRGHGLRARIDERRIPMRARRRPGGENEFERLRPYVPGDSYKHIDWKATARRREFITREYCQESNQNLIFLLDCGRMMTSRSGPLTHFDHALNAALMMGQLALRHGDRVGLLAFDRSIRAWLPPRAGARSGGRLIRGTYDIFPSLEEPDYAMAFRYLGQRVRRRSLIVLLTAVVDEVNAEMAQSLLQALSSRHLAMAVWLRDADLDTLVAQQAQTKVDTYVRCAAAEIVGWRERLLNGLRRRGALVVDSSPENLTPALLSRYLEIKARRLL
ncbi:MAG: DUF58 domain-containing protein [Proteobacteria bacterium]|nr:DUF58 domain-containing protein [Pseudomonadota bacterium]